MPGTLFYSFLSSAFAITITGESLRLVRGSSTILPGARDLFTAWTIGKWVGLLQNDLPSCPHEKLTASTHTPASSIRPASVPPVICCLLGGTCVQHGHNQDLMDTTGCLIPCLQACICGSSRRSLSFSQATFSIGVPHISHGGKLTLGVTVPCCCFELTRSRRDLRVRTGIKVSCAAG